MKKTKDFKSSNGFTLIELLVVIAIISILAAIALYSATQYINKGRDATIKGNLSILVTAGELWYDRNESSYATFCNLNDGSPAVKKAFSEIPTVEADRHCNSVETAWAVCAKLFVESDKAYCVDNKGNQKEINNTDCTVSTTNCCFMGITNCVP